VNGQQQQPQENIPVQAVLSAAEAELGAALMRAITLSALVRIKDDEIANLRQQLAQLTATIPEPHNTNHVHEGELTHSHGG
jgi:hypothetical protein